VRAELLPIHEKKFYERNMFSPFKQYDIYILFYEKGFEILRKKGLLGFITPNKFYLADYGSKIREFLLKNATLESIADVSTMNIFPEASVYPTILILRKSKKDSNKILVKQKVTSITDLNGNGELINQSEYLRSEDFIINTNITNSHLLQKIDNTGVALGEKFKIARGFRPPKDDLRGDLIKSGYHPYLIGSDLNAPYGVDWSGNTVNYIPEKIAESKPINIFLQPKIMIRDIGLKFNAFYDEGKYLCLKTIYFVYGGNEEELKFITGLLNSRLLNFYFREKYSSMHISGGYLRFRKQFIGKVPVIQISNSESHMTLVKQVDVIIKYRSELQTIISNLITHLQSKFDIEKLSKKLQNWYELAFKDFLKELKKAKVKLSLSEEAEWMQYFNEQKQKAQTLKAEIDKTDNEIDQMVYKLYGLTEEEIKIVEESV